MDDVNMNHDLTLQEMLVYIRNRNETAFDLERAFTALLDDTPSNPEGAGITTWHWNDATQTGANGDSRNTYAQRFGGAAYFKDHVFERQYISCIVIRRMKENDTPMNGRERATFTNLIFNFVRLMANIPANLCCIDGNLHNEKTRYFNVRLTDTAQAMTPRLKAYLDNQRASLGIAWHMILSSSDMPGQTSIPDLKKYLKAKRDNINKEVADAIIEVLTKSVNDFVNMPWIEEDNAEMFEVAEKWAIGRAVVP